jgi:hypothetical protein
MKRGKMGFGRRALAVRLSNKALLATGDGRYFGFCMINHSVTLYLRFFGFCERFLIVVAKNRS